MGKIRVKTLGDEELEKQQAEEAKKRHEAKKVEKKESTDADVVSENQDKKKLKETTQKKTSKGLTRSKSYQTKVALVDREKVYSLSEALTLLPQLQRAKFDETVEIHVNTTETGVSGSVTLPHGTGKQTRIAIADGSDAQGLEELVKNIESGSIDFDILIATPDSMPKLARVARILGPRGLMPNPKNGTVTPNPKDVAKKYEGGQINYKTESKFPLLHIAVGKVSFGDKKLAENIKSVFATLPAKQIKNVTLKSTMSPGMKVDLATL